MDTSDERLLVVVAHPDDETFGCGSLLAHARAEGVTTFVACATRGEAGSPTPGRGLDDADMAEVRAAELHAAAELLGVDRVVLFDCADSDMEGEPAPGTLCAAPIDEVAERIAQVIAEPDSAHLDLGDLGTPDDLITTYLDTSDVLDVRERAMALHASQTPPNDVMPPDLRRDFLATDRLRRVVPPWEGGERERALFAC